MHFSIIIIIKKKLVTEALIQHSKSFINVYSIDFSMTHLLIMADNTVLITVHCAMFSGVTTTVYACTHAKSKTSLELQL